MDPPSVPTNPIEDALSIMLYEISMRMDETTLGRLNGTSIGPLLQRTKKDELWWHGRVEYLVGRELPYDRTFEWQLIYNSLSLNTMRFSPDQDYATVGLVRVLVLVGAPLEMDPQSEARSVVRFANVDDFSALMSDARFSSMNLEELLAIATIEGNVEVVQRIGSLIILDEKLFPDLIDDAVESQEIRLVAFLLEKVTLVELRPRTWKKAVQRGRFDMFQLLMQHSPIIKSSWLARERLEIAIERNFPSFVPPLLSSMNMDNPPDWALSLATEIGRTEIALILLSTVTMFTEDILLRSLKHAKRRDDQSVVDALRDYLARTYEEGVRENAESRRSTF